MPPMQLKVSPPLNWHTVNDPDLKSLITLRRGEGDTAGVMQVSVGFFQGGQPPNPSQEELMGHAQRYGPKIGYGQPYEAASGLCAIGLFGTAVFYPNPQHRAQLWFVSNSRDMILVSYVCSHQPEPGELAEAQGIVNTATLVAVERVHQ